MISPSDLQQALLDVRKAYRLLHEYQRAALDTAQYIGSQLGFGYAGGTPNFSDPAPRAGKGNLGCWAWDWLNMVYYDMFFTRESDDLKFSIFLFSDTGFFVSDHPAPEKTDIKTFARAERSATKLGFLLYREWPEDVSTQMNERNVIRRWLEADELPALLAQRKVFGLCCDFARVCDETSADQAIDELVALAQSNGVPLERIKRTA